MDILKQLPNDRQTIVEKRNDEIYKWIQQIHKYKKVIVCGSTASVYITAQLMTEIAKSENGIIILSGKIAGRNEDFILDTNPYNSEYKFLNNLGINPNNVITLDVGTSNIDNMNIAFGNTGTKINTEPDNCFLIECNRESEEALVACEIAKQATKNNKSVLIVTPDIAVNQRIKNQMEFMNIPADFSAGVSGAITNIGRAVLNLLNSWIETKSDIFDKLYSKANYNLFDMLKNYIETTDINTFHPRFFINNKQDIPIWNAIQQTSNVLSDNNIQLNINDAYAIIDDTLKSVSVRPNIPTDTAVCVLGTIESRMQTADVVILTGLNDGMFPMIGYKNSWLPKNKAIEIGLPSPDKKISLQALDFMTLSCNNEVYWLRSNQSGGGLTIQSRFLSRIQVTYKNIKTANHFLETVREKDNIAFEFQDDDIPTPPADNSDIYVTDLELLIHNPYAYYTKHILGIHPKDDYWLLPDSRDFGNLIHEIINTTKDFTFENLVYKMDARAKEILPRNSILLYFWHKRFCDIARVLENYFKNKNIGHNEINGQINISGRNVMARADIVWDGIVADIKTGSAPTKNQLLKGLMPQIAIEGYILQNNGFNIEKQNPEIIPTLQFLQLKNNHLELIEYKNDESKNIIDNTLQVVKDLFAKYSKDKTPYEYYSTNENKYHAFDDFARIDK
ncbi:MAG: PD-(D/E)XK nuclease family protein [Alphaproteobacteria bacterium]|nr:PD-(D/E)XK nuclease family protein [Alphaproteobacteria bacterium]